MKPAERAILARQAYEKAIKAIRARPTRTLWARLLRAAENLRDALDDAARQQQPAR